jgi:two-component system, LytTR family, response regulator
MNMTCIITDDEQNSRETLRHLLAAIAPHITILAEAKNTEQAASFVAKLKPDILFLDINMPGQSGIEFLETSGPLDCHVIFITAYNEFAIKAFRLNAIDFLLKPIDPDELELAIKKVEQNHQRLIPEQISSAQKYFSNHQYTTMQRIALPTAEGIYYVDLKHIIYIESLGAYSKFVMDNQKSIVVSKVLKEFEDILSPFTFIRVHQSNIVNLQHVQKYVKGDGGQLWMSDGKEIEVSRRKKDFVIDALKKIAF